MSFGMTFGLFATVFSMQVAGVIPPPVPIPRPDASVYGSCPSRYIDTRTLTLRFDEGSSALPQGAKEQLVDLFTPVAGNPMAEIEVRRYFPYGARDSDDPAILLGDARFRAIEEVAASVGVSEELVGGSNTATGMHIVGGETRRVPYPEGRIEAVDVTVRVKTDCHPLAGLARRTSPYD